MNNKELIAELSKQLGWTASETSEMLSAFSSVVSTQLVSNNAISLHGLGLFEVKKKNERVSVNPASGKRYLIPPKLAPVFKPGTTLKNQIKELSEDE